MIPRKRFVSRMKDSDFEQISRRSVRVQVFERLRDNIFKGSWTPGTKLPTENELHDALGVSSVSIHKGTQQFVSLGLLETHRGEGTGLRTYQGEFRMAKVMPILALKRAGIFHMSCRTSGSQNVSPVQRNVNRRATGPLPRPARRASVAS